MYVCAHTNKQITSGGFKHKSESGPPRQGLRDEALGVAEGDWVFFWGGP